MFECSLDDSTTFKVKNVYNNFELQICWDYSANAVSQRIAGRIYDLVVSLDRLP